MPVLEDLQEITRLLTDVALNDPLSAILLAIGNLIIGFSVLVMVGFGFGAVLDLFTRD